MKLPRKKASVSTRRQRISAESGKAAPTLSYYSRRSEQELNTGRQIQREPRKPVASKFVSFWVRKFGLIVLLIALLAAVINSLTLSTNAKVISLSSGGNASFLHTQAVYQTAASKLLAGSIWNRNKITVDTAGFSRKLQAEFPELSKVSVTLPLLAHRPLVYIQPAQPAVIIVGSAGSFVLDSDGNALLRGASTASLAYLDLPVVTDQSNLKLSLDHQALTGSDISFIQTVIAQLAARHVTVSTMTLPAATSELDVAIGGQPYFVKFNLQGSDARQQAGTFLATQARLQSEGITPTRYIDVRVDGRAYYL
jgi:hypothetical protein